VQDLSVKIDASGIATRPQEIFLKKKDSLAAGVQQRKFTKQLETLSSKINSDAESIVAVIKKELRISPGSAVTLLEMLLRETEAQYVAKENLRKHLSSLLVYNNLSMIEFIKTRFAGKAILEALFYDKLPRPLLVEAAAAADPESMVLGSDGGKAKAKRKTCKKKSIHKKRQTHPINAKKIKRKSTIKRKKVNKKKYTKENR